MIRMYDYKREVPLKIIQSVIEDKKYDFIVEADSDIDKCLEAVCEMKDYLLQLKKDSQEKQEALKAQENPPEA